MVNKLKPILMELKRSFEDLYGLRLAGLVLYGSHARGDATSESDVDVLVLLKGSVIPAQEIHRTGKIVSNLSLLYDAVITCAFMSIEQPASEQRPLLLNAKREGIEI